MDEFLMLLQAKLDEAKSKGNVNSDISKIQNQIDKLKIQAEIDPKVLSNLTKQLETILGQKINIPNIYIDSKVGQQIGNNIAQNIADGVSKSSSKVNAEMQKMANQANKVQFAIDTEKYSTQIFKLQQELQKFGSESGEIFIKASNAIKQMENAYNGMQSTNGDQRLEYEKEYQKALSTTNNLLSQIKSVKANELLGSGDYRRSNFVVQLNNYLLKNTAMTEQSRQKILQWIATLDSADDITRGTFDNIKNEYKLLDVQLRKTGQLGLSTTDKLKQAWEKFGSWGFATGTMMTLVNQLRKIPEEVYEIDTAMTNLYKVTDETSNKYTQFLDSTSDAAHNLSRSISSLVEQTANWAKLGFSLDEAEQLSKISSIYANVGEVDNDTAVSDMVTAMKAFNIEASDSITIVDKLNKLGNEYATSAADLGDGLSRSASAMATSGTDINKTLAMLTGGTEITQNASEFGNFLKVGSMRIRGMKGDLEELGEEVDETVDSISKVQTQILNRTGGKVNIFDDMGNFRDYYDIMEDISKVYDDLSDTDKADLTEILFGKQRGNQGAALIQAFQSGQIQSALEATLNAEGSAMQEQERWMESLEAKTKQFEAAFQSLSSTVLDSDILKWFVDFGTGSVQALDNIIDKFGSLKTIGTIGSGIAGAKNLG